MMERMSSPPPLSHVSADGRAVMVDVSEKPVTERVAVAEGFVRISAELEARIRALLRRTRGAASSAQAFGKLSFDRDARRATIEGNLVDLSPREWMLLDLLLTQRDRVVTKDQIAESWAVERSAESGAGSIEVYIHRLRRKLEGSGLAIRTVRGLGYLLEEGES